MDIAVLSEIIKDSKDDINRLKISEEERNEFHKWFEDMIEKINSYEQI